MHSWVIKDDTFELLAIEGAEPTIHHQVVVLNRQIVLVIVPGSDCTDCLSPQRVDVVA